MSPSFGGLWRRPDFVKLWAGQTVSQFGSFVGGMALQFVAILSLGATPFQVSLLAACQFVPGFLTGLIAGVWVDRLPRRPILIAADIGRALTLATVPLAAFAGVLRIEQLFAVAAITSALTVWFDVAYQAYLPSLVGKEQILEGNSRMAASASVAEMGGFSISGWLVQALGGPLTVLIDAVSFLWSAALISRIRTGEPRHEPHASQPSIWREMGEGIRFVAEQPLLRALAVADLMLKFFSHIVGAVILIYLSREAGFSPGVLGLIFAVGGVTSFAGALLAGRSGRMGGVGRTLALALAVQATGMLFIPLATSVSLLGVALLVLNQLITDPAWSFYEVNETSLRQGITPDRLQGRMNASLRFAGFGAMLLGTLAGGALGETIGPRGALWVATGGTFLAALWLACSPVAAIRSLPAHEPVEVVA